MKFDLHILEKSVLVWRCHNLDYNRLKKVIKGIEVNDKDRPTYALIDQDPDLVVIDKLFRDEFNNINVFVFLRIKEVENKLSSVESDIISLKDSCDIKKKGFKKHVKLIELHLDYITTILQKLSRFVVLQQIIVKKLFENILKYYPHRELANDFLKNLNNCDQLLQGHHGISFFKINLSFYLKEISLMRSSLDSLMLLQNPLCGVSFEEHRNLYNVFLTNSSFQTCLEFDNIFFGKCQHFQSFIVSMESVNELKFCLIKLGFSLIDDHVALNFKKLTCYDSNSQEESEVRKSEQFHNVKIQENKVLCSWNSSDKSCVRFNVLGETSKSPKFMSLPSQNAYPNLYVDGYCMDRCLLMCHTGGIKNHVITDKLASSVVTAWLDGNSMNNSNMVLNNTCFEWLKSKNINKKQITVSTERTRFVFRNGGIENGLNYEYLISIDENIMINNEVHFPHVFVEIKKLSTNTEFRGTTIENDQLLSLVINTMVNEKLSCYPINSDLTLWKLSYLLKDSNNTMSDLHSQLLHDADNWNENPSLTSIDEFWSIGVKLLKKSIKIVPTNHAIDTHPESIFRSQDQDSQLEGIQRYWNEFDDIMENENSNFYVYSDELESQLSRPGNYRFIIFNKHFIESVFLFYKKIGSLFGLDITEGLSRPDLLQNKDQIMYYGAINSESTATDSSIIDIHRHNFSDRGIEGELGNSDHFFQSLHDQVMTLFYVLTLLTSSITTATTLGFLSFIHGSDHITWVRSLIVISLIISLCLSLFSLLLLLSRFRSAPWWHYLTCILMCSVITCLVCYGLVGMFV